MENSWGRQPAFQIETDCENVHELIGRVRCGVARCRRFLPKGRTHSMSPQLTGKQGDPERPVASVGEDGTRCEGTWQAGEPATGMTAAAAEVETGDGRAIADATSSGPKQQLVQGVVAVV